MGSVLSAEADGFAAMDRYESQRVQDILNQQLCLPGDRETCGREMTDEEKCNLLRVYDRYKDLFYDHAIFSIFCNENFDVKKCEGCSLEYLHEHKCREKKKDCNDCGHCARCDAIAISYL